LSRTKVDVRELIAWGLDEYPYRDSAINPSGGEFAKQIEQAQQRLTNSERYTSCPALLADETENVGHLFATSMQRDDLQEEYRGLTWTLGVVDLRCLLAFQRRLVFSATRSIFPIPRQDDWPQLISFAIGKQRSTGHRLSYNNKDADRLDISLRSSNPDLQLRLDPNAPSNRSPFSLYGGSPFFEVAEFRERWFLRDGYHRAYRLLQAGVYRVPSVVIRARTLDELGATEPWFFREDQFFSDRPPRVADFLDESLVLRYERTALHKVIRIRVEESLEPVDETDRQGEEQ
jgi:hypothetical protein